MYFIALGANLPSEHGAPIATLTAAFASMAGRGLDIAARSRWYRTPAFPPGAGPDYINAAAAIESALDPRDLLGILHQVEREMGRRRNRRWEARVCDLDLLACDDLVLPDPQTVRAWMRDTLGGDGAATPQDLILPHPRLHERGFVLGPLMDVAPDWRHPLLERTVSELYAALLPADRDGIVAL